MPSTKFLKNLCLISVIFLSAAAGRAEQYSDTQAGFSYELPDDWILRTVGNKKFKVAFGRMSEGGPANIGIILNDCDKNLGLCLLRDLNDMGKLYEKSGFTRFHVIDTHAFETVRQQVGIKGVIECKRIDGKLLRQSFYYFERKDGAKIVVSCSATDIGDTYDQTFDEILKSFRVTR
jgi:hypothetical protein